MNRNITATILIVIAAGIYLTITQGMIDQAKAVQAVNTQYASAIDSASKLIAVRDQVEKEWKNISPDDQLRLNKMIPGTVDNIRLIIDLNNVALKHGFSLSGITATVADAPAGSTGASSHAASTPVNTSASNSSFASIPTPTLDTVNVSFSVTAPYLQFISFMQDLEANLRIMDVTHLAVTGSDSGIYTFSVQLRTYWLRQH